jgi:glycerol uptake facilitator-like aquaporin
MCFGEYFPNPALALPDHSVTVGMALGAEIVGTCVLLLVILSLTDRRNMSYQNAISKSWAPFWIGMTVAVIISVFAPLSQGGFNPWRDFGPRLVALCFGWGKIALPGPRSGFWIYLVGPIIGALLAAGVYVVTLGRHYQEQCMQGKCKCE